MDTWKTLPLLPSLLCRLQPTFLTLYASFKEGRCSLPPMHCSSLMKLALGMETRRSRAVGVRMCRGRILMRLLQHHLLGKARFKGNSLTSHFIYFSCMHPSKKSCLGLCFPFKILFYYLRFLTITLPTTNTLLY